MFENNVPLPST